MMVMVLCVVLLAGVDPEVTSHAVELATDTGTLYGVLDLPRGDGPFPAVLIHPGSEPTDRDGNQTRMKSDSLKMLGHALTGRGIACLRIDKRGVAASAKAGLREEDLRIETYAADAAAWARFLRADERFTRLGFVGHSEGALIGKIAGQTEEFDAFVSLCGMGRKVADTLRDQLKGRFPPALEEHANAIITTLEGAETTREVHPLLSRSSARASSRS